MYLKLYFNHIYCLLELYFNQFCFTDFNQFCICSKLSKYFLSWSTIHLLFRADSPLAASLARSLAPSLPPSLPPTSLRHGALVAALNTWHMLASTRTHQALLLRRVALRLALRLAAVALFVEGQRGKRLGGCRAPLASRRASGPLRRASACESGVDLLEAWRTSRP